MYLVVCGAIEILMLATRLSFLVAIWILICMAVLHGYRVYTFFETGKSDVVVTERIGNMSTISISNQLLDMSVLYINMSVSLFKPLFIKNYPILTESNNHWSRHILLITDVLLMDDR